jgi:exopolysaccharide biosynthesis polyprenyl glycosylphosphotransferase
MALFEAVTAAEIAPAGDAPQAARISRVPRAPRVARRMHAGPLLLVADLITVLAITLAGPAAGPATVFTLVVIAGIGLQGGYRPRFSARLDRAVPRLVTVVAVGSAVILPIFGDRATLDLLRVLPALVAVMIVTRTLVSAVVRRVNRREHAPEIAVVLGAGNTGVLLVNHLREHREYGLEPVGFVDRVEQRDLPLPVLGDVDGIEAIVARTGARHLLVAYGVVSEIELVGVIRRCQLLDVDVWVIPRFFELGLSVPPHDADEIWGIPVARLPRRALRTTQWRLKRVFDLALSAAALALLAPTLAIVAVAVRLSSPGPIFFRQVRVGQRGRSFEVLKFRTMRVNDDSTTTWSVEADERVTRVGRILRRTCLDELPQLLNVLRGDMSLVGPRPERPYFVELFRGQVRCYDDRHRVPVGLTGLAQVNGLRGDTSIEQRATFDNNYIENWSLWSDITILARTLVAIVRAPGSIRTPIAVETTEFDAVSNRNAAYVDGPTPSVPVMRLS